MRVEWGGNVGKVCEWSEEARWENSEVAQLARWGRNEVVIWEGWEGSE